MANLNNGAEGVSGDEALREALEQVANSLQVAMLRQKQEAVEQATRALEAKMEERLCALAERMEERVATLAERMEHRVATLAESLARMERRVTAVEAAESASAEKNEESNAATVQLERKIGRGREDAVEKLEGRVQQLEASVQRALEGVIPRVDAVLQLMEGNCPPAPFAVPSSPPPGERRPKKGSKTPSVSTNARPSVSPSVCVSRANPSPAVQSSTLEVSASAASFPSTSAEAEELHKAAEDGRVSNILRLLNEGANVDHRNAIDQTPLMVAALFNHAAVVSLLLERGADVNAKCHCGYSPLHYASFHDCSGHCVKLLIDGRAAVQSVNSDGQTPLHCASVFGNEKAVRELNAAGASNTVKDRKGKFPSDYAKDPAIRELLLSLPRQPPP